LWIDLIHEAGTSHCLPLTDWAEYSTDSWTKSLFYVENTVFGCHTNQHFFSKSMTSLLWLHRLRDIEITESQTMDGNSMSKSWDCKARQLYEGWL
jgi:hypothetical protein